MQCLPPHVRLIKSFMAVTLIRGERCSVYRRIVETGRGVLRIRWNGCGLQNLTCGLINNQFKTKMR